MEVVQNEPEVQLQTFNGMSLWIKAQGLGQGWTRPAGRAPSRPSPWAADPRAGSTWK